jgi:hypothetical protein
LLFAAEFNSARRTDLKSVFLLLRFRHCPLGSLEADLGMRSVAERFRRRGAAAAVRHPLFRRIDIPVVVLQLHRPGHDVGPVLDDLDCYLSHNVI